MKRLLILFFILVITASAVQAKQLVNGYMILPNRDTIPCKIVVPQAYRDHIDLYFSVTINDNTGTSIIYLPAEKKIAGFGFTYDNKPYNYVLKNDGRNDVFVYREVTGNKLKLYYYDFARPIGTNGSVSAIVNVYLLEDDNRSLAVTNGTLSGYKKKIKKFIGNDPALQKIFDDKVSYFADIRNFVMEVNAL